MNKIKIGFSIDKWEEYGNYREILHNLSLAKEDVELYLITTSTDQDEINSISSYLELDSSHVFYCTGYSTLASILIQQQIQLYLTGEIDVMQQINESNIIVQAIYVNNAIQDSFNLHAKWITMLTFWMLQIGKNSAEGSESC